MSESMQDDPSTEYYCRPGTGKRFYEGAIRTTLLTYPDSPQLISVEGGTCAGIVYALPRTERPDWVVKLGSAGRLVRALMSVKPERITAGWKSSEFYESRREAIVKEHGVVLYVLVLSTERSARGQGLGSAALQALSGLADRQQVVCYVEATTLRSRALYARHGFLDLEQYTPAPGAPTTYLMWRPPTMPVQPSSDAQQDTNAGSSQADEGKSNNTNSSMGGGLFGAFQGSAAAANQRAKSRQGTAEHAGEGG